MINVFEPVTGVDDLKYLVNVLNSKWLWAGLQTERFVELFAKLQEVPADSLLPVSSCTDALFLACELFDNDGYGDVILPSIHFVGAANAVVARGRNPIFCDVDERTLNPHVEDIERVITNRTVAVILLHYGGRPCDDITQIVQLCKDKNLTLIEDSANSMISKKYGVACGTFGDIGMWSFDPMKLISCGDGGMMYIKDPTRMRIARRMCHFGLSDKSGMSSSNEDRWWEYDVGIAGRYSALTDIDSAILLTQMEKLNDFSLKRVFADYFYRRELAGIGDITLPPELQSKDDAHSYYFFWIQTDRRDDLAKFLRANDIYTTFRYYPLHRIKLYHQTGKHFPNADRAAKRTLLLPMHAGLTDANLDYICSKIKEFYAHKD